MFDAEGRQKPVKGRVQILDVLVEALLFVPPLLSL
jgi:hypothetical protein